MSAEGWTPNASSRRAISASRILGSHIAVLSRKSDAERCDVHERSDGQEVDPAASLRAGAQSDARERERVGRDPPSPPRPRRADHPVFDGEAGDSADSGADGDQNGQIASIGRRHDDHQEDGHRPAGRIAEKRKKQVAWPDFAASRGGQLRVNHKPQGQERGGAHVEGVRERQSTRPGVQDVPPGEV